MKKTDFGFEIPLVEKYISYSRDEGKYAIFEVPALPVGEYEVFVQYEDSDEDFMELDPPPYEPTSFQAKGAWPIKVSIPRK